jgi:hypothetical protein
MEGSINLTVQLVVGFAVVLLSLWALQIICQIQAIVCRRVETIFPGLRGQEALPGPPVRQVAPPHGRETVGPDVVRAHELEPIPRETLLAILQEAVAQTFPGKEVRVLSYGLPRVEHGSQWTVAGREAHFGSHRIRR